MFTMERDEKGQITPRLPREEGGSRKRKRRTHTSQQRKKPAFKKMMSKVVTNHNVRSRETPSFYGEVGHR